MDILRNSARGTGLTLQGCDKTLSVDAGAPMRLLARCPKYAVTPMLTLPDLAAEIGVAAVHLKDERSRMGLGSFKALGAAYVIARDAERGNDMSARTYVTASAGNHGLSVAMGARVFGAKAVIHIAETVPEDFAQRLAALGAEVVRKGAIYEDSMAAAAENAAANGWELLSDSSWPGYLDPPHGVMEGYLVLAAEAADQLPEPPTHIFLQAGVGGLAGAIAAYARHVWGDAPTIVVVEPDAAPALIESMRAGAVTVTAGPTSTMGRLDCKEPSLLALAALSRDADFFVTLGDGAVDAALTRAEGLGIETSPSGGAGLAAAMHGDLDRDAIGLGPTSRVFAILSEGKIT